MRFIRGMLLQIHPMTVPLAAGMLSDKYRCENMP